MSLKLVAAPTFKATVKIPAAGGDTVPIEFVFRHKTRAEFDAWASVERADVLHEDAVMEIASDWTDVEDSFSRESLTKLFDVFQASPTAIYTAYAQELKLGRQKN